MAHHLTMLAACCLPASLALAGLAAPQPLFLINTSPSEPVGLYIRAAGEPTVGRLAAFRPPQGGRAYAQAYLPEIGAGGILKTLVAGPGSQICAEQDLFRINGRLMGPIHRRDSAGRLLPHWEGCLTLGRGQYAAFSNRIPNSFDSRYYGPVNQADVIGAFEPLWVRP